MANLLPPVVLGPLTEISTVVLVVDLVPGAEVTLFENGGPLKLTFTATGTTAQVPLAKALAERSQVTASQGTPTATPPIQSEQSLPVLVGAVANPLPAPAYLSAVSTCTDAVWIDGITPGATVTVSEKASKLSWKTVAAQTPVWVQLPGSGPLATGATLEVEQTAHVPGKGTWSSAETPSYPLAVAAGEPSSPQMLMPAPVVRTPLLECQTSLDFEQAVASLNVSVINAGATEVTTAPAQSFTADGAPLAPGSTLIAIQTSTRCTLESGAFSAPVKKQSPPTPALAAPLCRVSKGHQWIACKNLLAGAVLSVELVWADGSGATQTQAWGNLGVPPRRDSFDLGTLPSTGPGGDTLLVGIRAQQILCFGTGHDRPSGWASFKFEAAGGPYPAPNPPENLFECARAVLVTGAHAGSSLQVFAHEGPLTLPLSSVVVADDSDVTIALWSPLQLGQQIIVQQTGCNADGTSNPPAPVARWKKSLPTPKVVAPVFAGATSVTVSDIVPGARATLFADQKIRSSVDSANVEGTAPGGLVQVTLPAGWPALQSGDSLIARQALCTELSPPSDLSVKVLQPVPDPSGGRAGNSNYLFADSADHCKPLTHVSVTIELTQDIVFQTLAGGPLPGFSFQLNGYSPNGAPMAWQQYGFIVMALSGSPSGPYLCGVINDWFKSDLSKNKPSIAPPVYLLAPLPTLAIPKGYKLTVSLQNSGNNVSAVTWLALDNLGNTIVNSTQPIVGLPLAGSSTGVTASQLAPIVAFELDIVGAGDGANAVLSSGAGTITYTASQPLAGLSTVPGCATYKNTTGEKANTQYGQVPVGSSTRFTQSFGVT